jgi:hypothetical protein
MKISLQFISESRTRPPAGGVEACDPLLFLLVNYLRQNRKKLRAEWVKRSRRARLLTGRSPRKIDVMAASMCAGYVKALTRGGLKGLRDFLLQLPRRPPLLGVGNHDALGLVHLLRDVFGRSLFHQFRHFQGREAKFPAHYSLGGGPPRSRRGSNVHPFVAVGGIGPIEPGKN